MIVNKLNFFFKHQIWHLGGLLILFYLGCQLVDFENNSQRIFWNWCKKLVFVFYDYPITSSSLCMVMLEIRIMLADNQ